MKRVTLVMVVGALLVALVDGVAVARDFQCNETPCNGTDKDDRIIERRGTSVPHDIRGLDGRDRIFANRFTNDNELVQDDQRNDTIRTDDGDNRDTVDCGSGANDVAVVDIGDAVNRSNCDTVMVDTGGGKTSAEVVDVDANGFGRAVPAE